MNVSIMSYFDLITMVLNNNSLSFLSDSIGSLVSTKPSEEDEESSFKNHVLLLTSALLLVSCHEKIWYLMKISKKNLLVDAARHNCQVLLKLLIQSDFNVNVQDNKGNTPLQAASDAGHKEIVKMLLKAKADPNIEGKYGNTALHFSCYRGRYEIAEMLIKIGAIIDRRNIHGETPLHVAVKNDRRQIIELLLREGARVDIQDCYGDTVLHSCVEKKDKVLVELLLEYGSDVTVMNRAKLTPVEIGVIRNSVEMMNILIPLIILERSRGKMVSETFKTISRNEMAVKIGKRCENEIEVSKKPIFGSTISFYDILFRSETQVAKFARNRILRRKFESENVCLGYPIYGDMIKRKFLKAISEVQLQDECYLIFGKISEFRMPLLCIEKIFSFLNVKELTDFIT